MGSIIYFYLITITRRSVLWCVNAFCVTVNDFSVKDALLRHCLLLKALVRARYVVAALPIENTLLKDCIQHCSCVCACVPVYK